jgi:primosomal protein N' (replication factor Y) (superfamily II helicase)
MPAHAGLGRALTYRSEQVLHPGTLVRVPFGSREVLGVVWQEQGDSDAMTDAQLRSVSGVLDGLAPLTESWCKLVAFTAAYYQRSLGEVALAALPPQLRELSAPQLARRLKRPGSKAVPVQVDAPESELTTALADAVVPSVQQLTALQAFAEDHRPALLFGSTGSGKTEVYLRAAAQALQADSAAQVLVMVPEINLTPQLEARFQARFAHLGPTGVVAMHSGLTPAQRLKSWLAAHAGHARLVLGTRMAVFASMPGLRLIVVDEEHDPSYKQQEGARYSARDLAVYRARLETQADVPGQAPCRVLLGSATPSLESWQASLTGRYQRLDMIDRIGQHESESDPDSRPLPSKEGGGQGSPNSTSPPGSSAGQLPIVRRIDMSHQPKRCVIAPPLLDAIAQRVARGEQSLVFLNRRGYAPVLACHDCGWKSQCPHCSAYRVFHKIDRTLRCHHCGLTERVPRACPECGNIDIAPVGRGTEQLEEHLAELLVAVKRPDGGAVRVARIDADSTRLKGALQAQLASVHSGEVDVLVGTQMIAKGHDFRHITLVAAINPDTALFSSDFRAPERLFSLLMQAAGRAGRDARRSAQSEMWVQTFHPQHPLFAALANHDYERFAAQQLAERQAAGLSPFGFCALLRAEGRTQEVAQGFLNSAASAAQAAALPGHEQVTPYSAVPMTIQRVANIERAQMLVESPSRMALQRFLTAWQPLLMATRKQTEFKSLVRWAIDVDPIAI